MKVKLKLGEGARIPTYGTKGAACFDIYATGVIQKAGNVFEYSTGLYFEIPEGHVLMVYSRSSQGFKYQTRLSNCVGVIDSDYRGELKVQTISDVLYGEDVGLGFDPFDLSKAIAQGMIIPVEQVQFEVIDSLSETERGSGGFGSTNKGNS